MEQVQQPSPRRLQALDLDLLQQRCRHKGACLEGLELHLQLLATSISLVHARAQANGDEVALTTIVQQDDEQFGQWPEAARLAFFFPTHSLLACLHAPNFAPAQMPLPPDRTLVVGLCCEVSSLIFWTGWRRNRRPWPRQIANLQASNAKCFDYTLAGRCRDPVGGYRREKKSPREGPHLIFRSSQASRDVINAGPRLSAYGETFGGESGRVD